MAVNDASYRGWDGRAKASHLVVFAIAGVMIRRLFRLRFVRYSVIMFPLATLLISSVFFTLFHQGEAALPGLSMAMAAGGIEPGHLYPVMIRWVWSQLGFYSLLLAAVVGAPLIAEDRRAHALPLYFSRPIGHVDYVVGKLLTLVFYLGLFFFLPPITIYLLDIGFTDEEGAAVARLPVMLNALLPAAVAVITLGSVALGASSLSRRTNYAALLFFGVMVVAGGLALFVARRIFHDPDLLALSPWVAARRIAIEMLPVPRQMAREDPMILATSIGAAWTSVALWTVAGLTALVIRVRNVEVVT